MEPTMTESGMEKVQVSLPSDGAVKITRSFRAPRALVFQAFTEPKLVKRWMLGPPGWSMPVCEMDVRAGGKYRWRWRSDEDGKEFGFSGEFREVSAPSRIVHTEDYDSGDLGAAGGEMGAAVVVTEFTEAGGVTTVTTLVDYGSRKARDAAVATGMTDGMELSYQNLDRILAEPAA